MQIRFTVPLARPLIAAAVALTIGLGARGAAAQVALEEEEGAPPPQPTEGMMVPAKTQIGLGVRLRNVRIPRGMLEAFVGRAAGSSSNFGIGLELSRRKGNFEFQFGLEYEKIFIKKGIWIDKGDTISGCSTNPPGSATCDEVDFVEFEDFGWVTAEATFLYHTEIVPQFAIRYGGGAGIAVMFGDVVRTDYVCNGSSPDDDCSEKPGAENVKTPYENIPPVFLVVNAIIGVQIRPTNAIFINVEGGLRTMPFFGMTAGYYF